MEERDFQISESRHDRTVICVKKKKCNTQCTYSDSMLGKNFQVFYIVEMTKEIFEISLC
jgi:hypothetical protein